MSVFINLRIRFRGVDYLYPFTFLVQTTSWPHTRKFIFFPPNPFDDPTRFKFQPEPDPTHIY